MEKSDIEKLKEGDMLYLVADVYDKKEDFTYPQIFKCAFIGEDSIFSRYIVKRTDKDTYSSEYLGFLFKTKKDAEDYVVEMLKDDIKKDENEMNYHKNRLVKLKNILNMNLKDIKQ